MKNVLWVDDDCEGSLSPLGWLLEDNNKLILSKAKTYKDAVDLLETQAGEKATGIHSALLDIIQIHSNGNGSLERYLGLTLAGRAADHGVAVVVFLTVVPRSEVQLRYKEIQNLYRDVKFYYCHKADLLEPHMIDALIEYLLDDEDKSSNHHSE